MHHPTWKYQVRCTGSSQWSDATVPLDITSARMGTGAAQAVEPRGAVLHPSPLCPVLPQPHEDGKPSSQSLGDVWLGDCAIRLGPPQVRAPKRPGMGKGIDQRNLDGCLHCPAPEAQCPWAPQDSQDRSDLSGSLSPEKPPPPPHRKFRCSFSVENIPFSPTY